MTDWLRDLDELQRAGTPAVRVTVAGVRGSAPREVGATMLVTGRDARGTIGGGQLEYQCTRIAAELLRDGGAARLRRFPLGSNCGQCCGGVVDVLFQPLAALACIDGLLDAWRARRDCALVTTLDDDGAPSSRLLQPGNAIDPDIARRAEALLAERGTAQRLDVPGRGARFVLIEPIAEPRFDIAVFGAGHVGSALVALLAGLDCRVRWIDSRRDIFPSAVPATVQCIQSDDPAREVAALPPGAFCLVMTHSHALDLAVTAGILRRGDFALCGLIGSAAKRRRFESRLRQQGIADADIARLNCPIGIAGIGGKTPQEIAIATAADVLRRQARRMAKASDKDQRARVHALRP